MKKLMIVLAVVVLLGLLTVSPMVLAKENPDSCKKDKCTTIQDGTIVDKAGEVITLGYDQWGYNYQAHMFNGWYSNYLRPEPAYTKDTIDAAPSKTWLMMKWNDAWLSNKDCDGDGLLDRHYGYDSYIGSGAWETNHQWGTYELDGKTCKWDYFVKIIAVPEGILGDGVDRLIVGIVR